MTKIKPKSSFPFCIETRLHGPVRQPPINDQLAVMGPQGAVHHISVAKARKECLEKAHLAFAERR